MKDNSSRLALILVFRGTEFHFLFISYAGTSNNQSWNLVITGLFTAGIQSRAFPWSTAPTNRRAHPMERARCRRLQDPSAFTTKQAPANHCRCRRKSLCIDFSQTPSSGKWTEQIATGVHQKPTQSEVYHQRSPRTAGQASVHRLPTDVI